MHGPRRSLVAQNYVDVINVGAHQVEVLPKIQGDVSQVRHNLARMVATTLRLALHSDDQTQVARVDQTVLDAMARLFCDELWKALRQGPVRRYETHEDNLVVLRGRLNVNQQIRHNLARPERFPIPQEPLIYIIRSACCSGMLVMRQILASLERRQRMNRNEALGVPQVARLFKFAEPTLSQLLLTAALALTTWAW